MRTVGFLAAAALATVPLVLGSNYYLFLATLVCIYAIVGVGLNLLVGYLGQVSLGHAAFFALGAYTSAMLGKWLDGVAVFKATGVHLWLGLILGILVSAAVGAAVAYPALRVKGPYLAMVTIAFGIIVFSVLMEWTAFTGGPLGITAIPRLQVAGCRSAAGPSTSSPSRSWRSPSSSSGTGPPRRVAGASWP